MIETSFERTDLGLVAISVARANHRGDHRFTYTGTEDEIRDRLRREYRAHIWGLCDDLITACRDNLSGEATALERALRDVAYRECDNHIDVARNVAELNLWPMLPKGEAFYRAWHILMSLTDCCGRYQTDRASLWVRGPVELLSGEIVKPWQRATQPAMAA